MIINFYEIDHNDFENEALVGTVRVENGKLVSNEDGILEIAQTFGGSVDEIIANLSSWSNGYLRSELKEISPVVKASGIIRLAVPVDEFHLRGQHDQSSHGHGGGGGSNEGSPGGGGSPTGLVRASRPGIVKVAAGHFSPEIEKATE